MTTTVHDFRPRAARWLAATGAVSMLPFAYVDHSDGQVLVALGQLALAAALAFGVWLLDRGHYSPVLVVAIFGLPAIALNTVAMTRFDVYVTFWAFVVVMAFYLVLPLRWALVLSGLKVAIVAPVTWVEHGAAVGSRFAVCLVLIATFGAVTVRLVDDRQRLLVERMATDPLTGVLNRSTLTDRLTATCAAGRAASLLILDVDHFKTINDRFGHDVGDRVLAGVAALVRRHVPDGAPVFRLGGEEFLVVLDDVAGPHAERVAGRLVAAVADHDVVGGHAVTISIGVAELAPGEGVNTWLRRADAALYRAKDAGRNRLELA